AWWRGWKRGRRTGFGPGESCWRSRCRTRGPSRATIRRWSWSGCPGSSVSFLLPEQIAHTSSLFIGFSLDGAPEFPPEFQDFRLPSLVSGSMAWGLAHMAERTVDAFEQRQQRAAKDLVILRTTEPALRLEFHVLYAACGAGQSRQLVTLLADVLAQDRLQDAREIHFLVLDELLLLRTTLAQVRLFFLAIDEVRQVHRGRIVAELAFHDIRPWSFVLGHLSFVVGPGPLAVASGSDSEPRTTEQGPRTNDRG